MCETCCKWRRVPDGAGLDAEAAFTCDLLPGGTCDAEEEAWAAAAAAGGGCGGGGGDGGGEGPGQEWAVMDLGERKRAR